MKIAIVHDWIVNYGGAERVVESLLKILPEAEIFTLVFDEKKCGNIFPKEKVHTSFLQKIPKATKLYTKFLPLMPRAFESFDFSSFDLVVCSSSSCAKGVITPPAVPHIAYIHSPMRYAWDLYFDYKKNAGLLSKISMPFFMPQIRAWDFYSSQRIDEIIANSSYISRRIKKYWNRTSVVIHPPVETSRLSPNNQKSEDFYVVFSRFVPYKRIDLAISSCAKMNRNLVVIGSGYEEKNLKNLAKSFESSSKSKITFTGRISDDEVKDYLQRCKALIFCAEEDFGIIPVEAQACGRAVIAFGKGGAVETVLDGKTGVLFEKQSEESLIAAIERFEKLEKAEVFDAEKIAEHAKKFSEERFLSEMKAKINEVLQKFGKELLA